MLQATLPSPHAELRRHYYNAKVTRFQYVHEDLGILEVALDEGRLEFLPGQYTTLGLGTWEPRVDGCQSEPKGGAGPPKLIRRAYSISCPILDEAGRLVSPTRRELEFYIALVRAADSPPALTPRLFRLRSGDRIHVGRHCLGQYTLRPTTVHDTILFLATGTGEAPHNAMLAELFRRRHRGRIVSLVCARQWRDFAYLNVHRELEQRYGNYRYLTLTTREPVNLDDAHPNFVGRRYIQDYFASGSLESDMGFCIRPDHTHVYLCGNPAMIGLPRREGMMGGLDRPGMIQLLEDRGFSLDRPHVRGNVHFEKYW